jgi:methane/ammonia monooxygenase subunit B
MVEKKIFVLGLTVVLALGTLGFNWVETILPTAEAHGVVSKHNSRVVSSELKMKPSTDNLYKLARL